MKKRKILYEKTNTTLMTFVALVYILFFHTESKQLKNSLLTNSNNQYSILGNSNSLILQDTPKSCVIERFIDNKPYFYYYDNNSNITKKISILDFIDSLYKELNIKSKEKIELRSLTKKGFALIDSLNLSTKREFLSGVMERLPNEDIIEKATTVCRYSGKGEAYIWINKYVIYNYSIYLTDNSGNWGPLWVETNIDISDFTGKSIGKIKCNKLLEKITLSDDGKYLLAEINGFSSEEGGDNGLEGFQLFDVRNGELIYHIPFLRKNGQAESIEYENNLFKITTNNWKDDGGIWRFLFDVKNKVYYKKLYFSTDQIWEGKNFSQFKSKVFPDGLEENLANYEAISF